MPSTRSASRCHSKPLLEAPTLSPYSKPLTVPDEQILPWEQKVSPERSQRPFRSIVGKAIPEVILEEIAECDSGTFCRGAHTPPPEQ